MPAAGTYTYSSNPATDQKDAVRMLLKDTNQDGKGWLLSDEEILYLLGTEGSVLFAAAAGAETIAALYTGPHRNIQRRRIGDLDIQAGRSARGASDDWYALAQMLRRRGSRGAMPYAGGIDIIDREERFDPTMLQPEFQRGMDNYIPNDRSDFDSGFNGDATFSP